MKCEIPLLAMSTASYGIRPPGAKQLSRARHVYKWAEERGEVPVYAEYCCPESEPWGIGEKVVFYILFPDLPQSLVFFPK